METDNPHNFLMVDKIMRQALSASLLEAYLEAAPQIIIQTGVSFTIILQAAFSMKVFIASFL
jgi:hypothetical protein